MQDAFFIVWNPDGPTNPRQRHDTFSSAASEAARLARVHPGADFFVMEAHRRCRTVDPIEIEDFDTDLQPPF
jgi:hypothetical protein